MLLLAVPVLSAEIFRVAKRSKPLKLPYSTYASVKTLIKVSRLGFGSRNNSPYSSQPWSRQNTVRSTTLPASLKSKTVCLIRKDLAAYSARKRTSWRDNAVLKRRSEVKAGKAKGY